MWMENGETKRVSEVYWNHKEEPTAVDRLGKKWGRDASRPYLFSIFIFVFLIKLRLEIRCWYKHPVNQQQGSLVTFHFQSGTN